MSAQITLNLPDELYRRAQQLAARSGREVADILTATLAATLPNHSNEPPKCVEELDDREILALTESHMNERLEVRMSDLLEQQQAGTLDDAEAFELSLLLYRYQEGSLRKAEALAEAVRRGLRPALDA
ncbi:MAG: hypothetical protein KC547_08740 [Anaerolineae bacterium]|nr:hypothetical protein [Anaerolineae bacterium]